MKKKEAWLKFVASGILVMTKKEAWEKFKKSGKVEDYLEYKRIS